MAKTNKAKQKKPVTTKTRVVTTTVENTAPAAAKKSKAEKNTVKKAEVKKDVTKKSKTSAAAKATKKPKKHSKYNVFAAFWRYLKGSWYELTQVRWPNRRETWGMTLAVIFFSVFFVVLILGLDAIYKYLFDLILER